MNEELKKAIQTLKMIEPTDLYIRQRHRESLALIEKALTEDKTMGMEAIDEIRDDILHSNETYEVNDVLDIIDSITEIITKTEKSDFTEAENALSELGAIFVPFVCNPDGDKDWQHLRDNKPIEYAIVRSSLLSAQAFRKSVEDERDKYPSNAPMYRILDDLLGGK